jgi:hypothetical protein
MKVVEMHGGCGFVVEGIPFSRLCVWLSEFPGVEFTRRRWFFWSARDIRAEFALGGHSFRIQPEPGGKRVRVCPGDESSIPCEIGKLRDYVAGLGIRERQREYKRAISDGILSACASLIVWLGGWAYPAYLLKYDPDIRGDPDFRAGAVVPISILVGLVFAGWAIKSFCGAYLTASEITPPQDK